MRLAESSASIQNAHPIAKVTPKPREQMAVSFAAEIGAAGYVFDDLRPASRGVHEFGRYSLWNIVPNTLEASRLDLDDLARNFQCIGADEVVVTG